MSDISILAATERYDKILSDMTKDLDVYKKEMDEILASISHTLSALAHSWQGEAEIEFQHQMRDYMRKIGTSLERVYTVKGVVDEKIVPIRKALALMRGQK